MQVLVNQMVETEMPFSEVCMHMRVAGQRMKACLLNDRFVQLFRDNGQFFSFPILRGEAGFHQEESGEFYIPDNFNPSIC